MSKNARHRSWCYTWNNYSPEEAERCESIEAVYHVFGKEVAESGTPHLQGFIHFKNAKTMSAVKKVFGCNALHLGQKRGTFEQASVYCKKDDKDYFEEGELPQDPVLKGLEQKERWTKVWELAKLGQIDNIAESDPHAAVVSYRTLKMIGNDHIVRAKDNDECTGVWFYGGYGCGKSHLARKTLHPDAFIKDPNQWWCGYQNEEAVILEDLDPLTGKYIGRFVKVWGDKYSFKAPTKHSSTFWIRPKVFIVTSQYLPEEIWPHDHLAIYDRFQIIHLPGGSRRQKKKRPNPYAEYGTLIEGPKKPRLVDKASCCYNDHAQALPPSSDSQEALQETQVQSPQA